ncbi:MAG: fused MFS/spermidine synthase [Pseudomonadota bacterium]
MSDAVTTAAPLMQSEERAPLRVFWPAVTLTLSSAASMALEIVAGRALAPYVGMSLYSWTMVIAVVLAGLSLGHWLGGLLADRTARPARFVALALSTAALATLLSLGALRMAAPGLEGTSPVAHAGFLAFAAFFLPSALAGLLAPLLTVIALSATPPERQGRVLGLMFALGAAGAIIGTLAAGLVMISWLGTAGSVGLIAAVYAILAIRFWRAWASASIASAGVAVLALVSPGALGLASACMTESAYFCIRVDNASGFGRPGRVMVLDHLAHGVNDYRDPRFLLSPYVHGVDELVGARFPGDTLDAFFVGGGAYTLPRAWQERYPKGRFVVAELDPAVSETAKRHLWFTPAARTEIRHGDARRVLTGLPAAERFDVIFGDAFHDVTIPAHLVTHEFAEAVAGRLRPGGIYAMNVVDALREPIFALSLATTLRASFGHVELWLDRQAIGPGEARTTWILLASDRAMTADGIEAGYGFGRDWVRVPLDDMMRAVGRERIVFLTDDYAPVDRLLAPVLFDPALGNGG